MSCWAITKLPVPLYSYLTIYSVKKLIFFLLSLSLLISCKDDQKETSETDKKLSFSTKTIEKRLNDCEPENGECTFISLRFPVAKDAEKEAEKINKAIENFLWSTIDYQEEGDSGKPEDLAENFIKNYQETASEFPEYELPWEATINGGILFKSSEVICIQFKTDMFTGGAHGYRSTNYLNFDPETGKKLKPENIFTSEFKSFVEQDFRKKHNIQQDSNINSTGMFFENDEFYLPQNIGITKDKIILHYNAYEIAPYAAGNFTLTYSKSEIEEFLKSNTNRIQA